MESIRKTGIEKQHQSKAIVWVSIVTGVIFMLCAFGAIAGGAKAEALVNGGYSDMLLPAPPPTAPPTLGPGTPTSEPGQSATPNPPGTPTVPGPVPTEDVPPGPCGISFTDVVYPAWFYEPIMWMACNGIVSGYPDGTFRPGNPATRGQIVKIVVGAYELPLHTTSNPSFADVEAGSTFYDWIETASYFGIVEGYPCGGDGEPCNAENDPYYRPNGNVSRGQLTKIIVLGAQVADPLGWPLVTPPVATFVDVPVGSTFFAHVETAVAHGVLEGYPCGGPGEPCPGRYFRPNGEASRAQLSKMVFVGVNGTP